MRRVASLAVLPLALAAAPPAGAQQLDGAIARVSAADGVVLYSQRSQAGPWALVLRGRGGAVARLPVAPSAQPLQADLGTDARGRLVAVYASCAGGIRCRLRQIDLATNRDRYVPGSHAAGHDETAPTVWNGVVGFQRSPRGRAGGAYRLLALRPGARSRAVKRLRGDQTVTGADLAARGLAIATARDTDQDFREVSVQVKPTGRPFRTLHTAVSGAMSHVRVTTPSWRGNHVLWGFARLYDSPSRMLLRARIARSGTTYAAATAPTTLEHGTIAGVAADAVSSEAPIWLLTEAAEGEDRTRASLAAHAVPSLTFGPAPRGIGLGR